VVFPERVVANNQHPDSVEPNSHRESPLKNTSSTGKRAWVLILFFLESLPTERYVFRKGAWMRQKREFPRVTNMVKRSELE
jgi:hypothetical protein